MLWKTFFLQRMNPQVAQRVSNPFPGALHHLFSDVQRLSLPSRVNNFFIRKLSFKN